MFSAHVRAVSYRGCAVLELHGELDIATGVSTGNLLAAVTACERVTIVDLADLGFMDCSGLRALIHAQEHAGDAGHALLLATPGEVVRQVLEMTGTARLFSIHASVAAAARAAAGAGAGADWSSLPVSAAPSAREACEQGQRARFANIYLLDR